MTTCGSPSGTNQDELLRCAPLILLIGGLPPVVVHAFLMDYYVSGLTTGATRG